MPVDLYVGGGEHAVLHLLYARFWHKVLFDLGVVKDPEPFLKLVHQGMILGENNEKMSKARGNVVNPDDVVRDYGADALRVYEMFMGPARAGEALADERHRRACGASSSAPGTSPRAPLTDDARGVRRGDAAPRAQDHPKVTRDIEALRFNTAISAMMILVRHLGGLRARPARGGARRWRSSSRRSRRTSARSSGAGSGTRRRSRTSPGRSSIPRS